MPEDDSSTLVILLDTHKSIWAAPFLSSPTTDSISPTEFIDQVLNFCKAFLLVSEGNKLALFAVHHTSCPLLYASPNLTVHSAATVPGLQLPGPEVKSRLASLLQQSADPSEGPALAGGLSRVLCYLHKIKLQADSVRDQHKKHRILCLQGTTDVSVQYISFMNAIFSAQRGDYVIDACMLGSQHSALLQQACHLTGGIYSKPGRPTALLQYLLAIYLADTHSRSFLMLPKNEGVDFRASCFCHKKSIDLGYVCSVCLSIFCQSLQECSTCGTPFPALHSGTKRKDGGRES